jgi:hypothetical protein
MDLPLFTKCYQQGIRTRIEQRRREGLPVPETLGVEPDVEID